MTDVSSGFSRPVALGVAITDSHIRIVRLELRDTPVVTDAVSLRLSPGDVIDGYVCHQQAVVDLLRRVWDQLKLTWEPVYVALCSPDAQLVTVDLNDPDALELVMDNLGVGRPQAGDSIVGLEIGGVPGFAAMNVARLSSILRIQELADTAGISLAGVDTLPCSLARSQPAACYDPHETALRYNDGRSVWSIRLGGYVATTLSSPPLGDRNPDDKPTFDRIALGTETSITSVAELNAVIPPLVLESTLVPTVPLV